MEKSDTKNIYTILKHGKIGRRQNFLKLTILPSQTSVKTYNIS